ncbi:heme-dependent oxidative N-demethylase family protein [Thetidibacter halocola]|uniref:DUF3445 domain-containing protein n=1 Tax=Thetidibacter halocola TaxID=2827239 RepID=A0A8J8B9G2_9RHOB|nr:DUF3445 domain-containing protein [Thetidibacter halocola]MBS0124158.1 DUF3445 domain-containing protein [Thetidibacter halocola]
MILQSSLPYDPFDPRPLPGIAPLDPAEWLHVDDAYAAQMAERARLLAEHAEAVLWQDPSADAAVRELLDMVLEALPEGFARDGDRVTCPDGRRVTVDRDAALRSLNALVQEDFCILMKDEGEAEHVLRAAILCFPASWMLSEKAGRPLLAIHAPVHEYPGDLARRVQRLFDGVRPGRPLWRFNALWYADPTLHQPRSVHAPRPAQERAQGGFLRSERQCILRLPQSGAVVFSIHTYMLARASVSAGRP